MIKENKIINVALADTPEWLDTSDVKNLGDLLRHYVVCMEYQPLYNLFKLLFIKYGVFAADYVKENYPELYPLIEGEKPSDDLLAAINRAPEELVEPTSKLRKKENTSVLCERAVIKNHKENIESLRKQKGALKLGLTARTYHDRKCIDKMKELQDFGCDEVMIETRLGVDTERVITKSLFKQLKAGDTLVITQGTNIAKSSTQLFKIVLELMDNGIDVISLKEKWLDTTIEANKQSIKTVFEGMQMFEQDILVEHKNNAVKKAQAEGVKFGRSLKDNANIERAIEMYINHKDEYTVTKIAEMNNISRTTLWRRLRDMNLLESK